MQKASFDIRLSDTSDFDDRTATNLKTAVQAKTRLERTGTYHTQQFKSGGEAQAGIPFIRSSDELINQINSLLLSHNCIMFTTLQAVKPLLHGEV